MSTLAKVVPIPKGSYSSSATYNSLDIVRYDGKSWMCKQDSVTGVTPTDGTYWMLIVQDGGGATSLTNLSDVTVSSPSNGQILLYNSNSGVWENSNFTQTASLDDLTDVTITSVADNNILVYDSATSKWKNAEYPTSSPATKDAYGSVKVGKGLFVNSNNSNRLDLQSNIVFSGTVNSTGAGAGSGATKGQIVHIWSFSSTIYLTTKPSGASAALTFGHDYEDAEQEDFLSVVAYPYDSSDFTNIVPILGLTNVIKTVSDTRIYYTISGNIAMMAIANGDFHYGSTNLQFNFVRKTWNIQK